MLGLLTKYLEVTFPVLHDAGAIVSRHAGSIVLVFEGAVIAILATYRCKPLHAFLFASPAAFAFAAGYSYGLPGVVLETTYASIQSPSMVLGQVVALAILACTAGLVALAWAALVSAIRGSIFYQDGSRCWACGHDISETYRHQRCSECGTPFATAVNEARQPAATARHGKRGAWLVVATCVLLLVTSVGSRIVSTAAAYGGAIAAVAAIVPGGMTTSGVIFQPIALAGDPLSPPGIGADGGLLAVRDSAEIGLLLMYNGSPPKGYPVAQLQLVAKGSLSHGDPIVVANLSEFQLATISSDGGVRDTLVAEIVATAKKVGWRPVTLRTSKVVEVDVDKFVEGR